MSLTQCPKRSSPTGTSQRPPDGQAHRPKRREDSGPPGKGGPTSFGIRAHGHREVSGTGGARRSWQVCAAIGCAKTAAASAGSGDASVRPATVEAEVTIPTPTAGQSIPGWHRRSDPRGRRSRVVHGPVSPGRLTRAPTEHHPPAKWWMDGGTSAFRRARSGSAAVLPL